MTSIAIVGTGFMGRTHLERLLDLDVEIAAVTSRTDPSAFVDEYELDAVTYTDAIEMCHETDVDAVDICTPTDTHTEFALAAIETGKHVFLEKPVAGSLADARTIAGAVDDASVTCMVGHALRFFPEYRQAKRQYDSGSIGNAGVARARRLSPFPDWGSTDWYADRDRSGGVFVDLAIHDLDFLRWTWGDVERVFARRFREGRAEHGSVTLRFASGAVGYVEASWAQPDTRELTYELELAGDDGLLELSSENATPFREFDEEAVTVESPVARDGYHRELDHFVECLESDTEPDVTVGDAVESLRLALAARQSAERNEPVVPTEVRA